MVSDTNKGALSMDEDDICLLYVLVRKTEANEDSGVNDEQGIDVGYSPSPNTCLYCFASCEGDICERCFGPCIPINYCQHGSDKGSPITTLRTRMKTFRLNINHLASLLNTRNKYQVACYGLYLGMGFATIRAIQAGLIDIDETRLMSLAQEAGYQEGCVELYDTAGRKLYPFDSL
jgi:hypothetical protein